MIDTKESVFWKEIFEQPEAVRNCLKENEPVLREIAKEVKERKIKTVVFVGRGSSDHANLVGRYLFETKCSMVASICAPSVVTAYHSNVDYSNVLMIAVSQSGGARDIYEVMKHCDEQGGVCVCVTNVEGSLMTQAGKYQVRNHCGPERSVTAGYHRDRVGRVYLGGSGTPVCTGRAGHHRGAVARRFGAPGARCGPLLPEYGAHAFDGPRPDGCAGQ